MSTSVEAGQPNILGYHRGTRRGPWRLIRRLLLLALVISPFVYWRAEIQWQAQYRYHVFALWRAQQHMLGIKCPDGGSSFATHQAWANAWERMGVHEFAIARLNSAAGQVGPKIKPRVLLSAPMKRPDGAARHIVIFAMGDELRSEEWTLGGVFTPPTRSALWQREPCRIVFPPRTKSILGLRSAKFDPKSPSAFEVLYTIDGVERKLAAQVRNSGEIEYGGDAWTGVSPRWIGSRSTLVWPGDSQCALRGMPEPDWIIEAPDTDFAPWFGPDGTLLLAGRSEWDSRPSPLSSKVTRVDRHRLSVGDGWLWSPQQFSPNGRYLYQLSPHRFVRVVDVTNEAEVLQTGRGPWNSFVLSDQIFCVASAQLTGVWRLPTGEVATGAPKHGQLRGVCGRYATYTQGPRLNSPPVIVDTTIQVVDLDADGVVATLALGGAVDHVALSPDATLLAQAAHRSLSLWRVPAMSKAFDTRAIPVADEILSVLWSPDSRWLAYSDANAIYVIAARTLDCVWQMPNPMPGRRTVPRCFSPDGRWLLATTDGEIKVCVWDMDKRPPLAKPVPSTAPVLP